MTASNVTASQRVDTAHFSYTIRPAAERDLTAVNDFYNLLTTREPGMDGETTTSSLSQLEEWWAAPRREKNTWLLVHAIAPDGSEGELIGDLEFEPQEKPGERIAWTNLQIHPDYRNKGVGSYLYDMVVQIAGASNCTAIYMGGNTAHKLKQQFLERRGFTFDRYFWQMRLPAGVAVDPATLPAGYTVRTYQPAQDLELFRLVRNETFADHFGSTPRTTEEMQHTVELSWFQPEGLFFASDGAGEVAGYCWSAINREEWQRRGAKIGWIEHLGVMPNHRRAGLGRSLLLTGIGYLRQECDVVELGVEGKNERALPLYTGVGFQQHNGWVNMRKKMGSDEDDHAGLHDPRDGGARHPYPCRLLQRA